MRARLLVALAVVGALLVSTGVWFVYPPAGLIAAGVLCLAGGLLIDDGRPKT